MPLSSESGEAERYQSHGEDNGQACPEIGYSGDATRYFCVRVNGREKVGIMLSKISKGTDGQNRNWVKSANRNGKGEHAGAENRLHSGQKIARKVHLRTTRMVRAN